MTAPCRFCEGRDLHHGKYVGEADWFTRCNVCGAQAPSDTWESQPEDWDDERRRIEEDNGQFGVGA